MFILLIEKCDKETGPTIAFNGICSLVTSIISEM